MMCVLQRTIADHRLTYGELAIRDMTYVTLESPLAYIPRMVGRIPSERYVIALDEVNPSNNTYAALFGDAHRGMLSVQDVYGRKEIIICAGTLPKQANGNILVGFNRSGNGTIEGTLDAYWEIYQTLVKAMDNGDEVFVDVRDGNHAARG